MGKAVRKVVQDASGRPGHAFVLAVSAILGAGLGQLAVELGKGNVPIPAEWAWTVPIAIAVLVTTVGYLPSPASRGGKSAT